MPSLKRGFVFKYFDKIICGLVALGLLVGIVYALSRSGALPQKIQPQNVNKLTETIKNELQGQAHKFTAQVPNAASLDVLARTSAVRGHMFIWPLPVEYPPIKVGLNKTFVLQFKAPLGAGTVSIQGTEPIIEIVQHPVDGDYSKVQVRSKSFEGQAAVVGYEGRIAHIYPVIVDASVNKTAYPPTLKVTNRQGSVTLKIVEDPKIRSESVEIFYYEIWRRDWSNPLGKYELVDEVDQKGNSLSGSGAAKTGTVGPTAGPPATAITPALPPYGTMPMTPGARGFRMPIPAGGRRAPGRGGTGAAKPAAQPGVAWTDPNVQPGDQYSYKARAIGKNTFPTEGDYCAPVMAQVLPDVDFRFTLTTAESVHFDVVKAVGSSSAKKQSFWRGVGDAIGTIATDRTTGQQDSYLTGYFLVDIHPAAARPNKPGPTGRVIYADKKGNLRVLWNGETKSDALWNRLKAAAAPAPGARMFRLPYGPIRRPGVP